jgi:polyisoprenoid-binding protein YceI
MKTKITFLTLLTAIISLSSFTAPAPVKFQVDTKASTLNWTASKVTGTHKGTVPVQAGELTVDGKTIKQGSFEIDLASLAVTDITDPTNNAKLVGHLKSPDFFNTAAHPKATFVIGSVTPRTGDEYTVKGKLTIKGITKDIEFPATVKQEGKKLTASAKIKVNRTHYDIRYGSKSFFDNLGDKAIDDEFELDLKLVANS